MHPVIAQALALIPGKYETPRPNVLDLPVEFEVGEVLFNVHIRINTPTYTTVHGSPQFESDDTRRYFEANMHCLIAQAGMAKDGPWFYPDDGADHEYLHCHPGDLSGVISAKRIAQLVTQLQTGNYGADIRWVDIYKPHEIVGDAEAAKRLDFFKTKIRQNLLSRCMTTRRTKFVGFPLSAMLAGLPGFSFAGDKGVGGYVERTPEIVVSTLDCMIQELVSEGWLNTMTRNGQTYYRTSNKSEQKARGLLKKPAWPAQSGFSGTQAVLL